MPVRRALVESAVLSVQDQSFFYPYCISCFSKVDVQQQDTNRVVCSQCGTYSVREQVNYRYRLALKVIRDTHIFTVTVFGTCLNPFFGIPASGLQRLLEDPAEPIEVQTRIRLLGQAVEDCFIGRHFIFAIKATDWKKGLLFGGQEEGPAAVGSSCREPLHYIATQITLPKATAQVGCSVISYYRALLQKAASGPLEGTGPRTVSRPPILLHQSPTSSYDSTPASCLLSQSLKSLNPTPAWQQSFSLITSSAEQEEGCKKARGDIGELVFRQNDSRRSQSLVQGSGCWENHGAAEQGVLSPPRSFCENFWTGWSFTASPVSPIHQASGRTPTLHTWTSPAQPDSGQAAPLRDSGSAGAQNLEPNNVSCLGSVAWEDMPFSESLGEFLCEDNEELHRVSRTEQEPTSITSTGEETAADRAAENRSPGLPSSTEKSSTETDIHPQDNTPSPDVDSHGGTLLNITNTSGLSYGVDFTSNSFGQTYSNVDWNVSENRQVCPPVGKREGEVAGCASTQKSDADGVEQIGLPDREGVYDCSADLFDSSMVMDINAQITDSDVRAEPKVQMTRAFSETPARPPRKDLHKGPHPTQLRLDTQDLKDGQKATGGPVLSEPSNTSVQHSNRHDAPDLNSNNGSVLAQKEYSNLRVERYFNNSEKGTIYTEQCEDSLSLDFIPPSQSTPLVMKAVTTRIPAPVKLNCSLVKPGSRDKIKPRGPCVSDLTPVRRGSNNGRTKLISPFCKSNKHGSDSQHLSSVQQAERASESAALIKPVQTPLALHNMKLKKRRPLSRHSTVGRTNHYVDKSLCNTSVCDKNVHDTSKGYGEDDELMVPPTTDKNRDQLKHRKRGQIDDSFRDVTSPLVNCKRTLLYRSATPRGPKIRPVGKRQTQEHICTQPDDGQGTSLSPNTSVNKVSFAESISSAAGADTEGCDWSRDLFSDSF